MYKNISSIINRPPPVYKVIKAPIKRENYNKKKAIEEENIRLS